MFIITSFFWLLYFSVTIYRFWDIHKTNIHLFLIRHWSQIINSTFPVCVGGMYVCLWCGVAYQQPHLPPYVTILHNRKRQASSAQRIYVPRAPPGGSPDIRWSVWFEVIAQIVVCCFCSLNRLLHNRLRVIWKRDCPGERWQ